MKTETDAFIARKKITAKLIKKAGGPTEFAKAIAPYMPNGTHPSKQRVNNWLHLTGIPARLSFVVEKWAVENGHKITAKEIMCVD
jgi:hypothetical protein